MNRKRNFFRKAQREKIRRASGDNAAPTETFGRSHLPLPRLRLWSETRTQILLCYLGLMALLIGGSIPAVYQVLFQEVERRAEAEIQEEIQEFRAEIATLPLSDRTVLRNLVERYLQNDARDTDQYLLFILEEQLVASNPANLPIALQPGSPLMEEWRSLKRPLQKRVRVEDANLGEVIYQVEPVYGLFVTEGVFVVAYSTANEQREIDRVIRVVLGVMLLLLAVASILAWLISGQILRPLRSLSSTARSISDTDLSQRIPITGSGELAEVAQTFNDMMDRLQEAFQSQQEFINDASHELRTPITIIQGHLDLMGDDPEEQAEVVELVHDELNRMNRFVNDLLLLAKARRPDFIQLETVEMGALTEELFQKAKVVVACRCQLESKAEGELRTDRQRLTQAILNLVENANQHTPAGGEIAIGSSCSRKFVRFWVRDTGVGIAPADQARIFERFARASDTVRRSDGAGLGLAIVQAIALGLGGRVELKSSPGQGSTFTLLFPIAQPKNKWRTSSSSLIRLYHES
ncbi:MAG: ATP-binding protein [Oculatellaceae cyanobacterium Prado106]|nr:ATP-binding protein [Oculatellaceae cyanobacterium Prado106]